MGHYLRMATLEYLWVMESEATEWNMAQEKVPCTVFTTLIEIISKFKKT